MVLQNKTFKKSLKSIKLFPSNLTSSQNEVKKCLQKIRKYISQQGKIQNKKLSGTVNRKNTTCNEDKNQSIQE